jgi:hypothetical protein
MDTLYGGLTGAAVSGGLIGYRMVVQDIDDYRDTHRCDLSAMAIVPLKMGTW